MEVAQRFRFLVEEYAFDGPDYSEQLLPAVRYVSAGLRIAVFVFLHDDSHDGAGRKISVSISLATEHGSAKADLAELVESVAFAPRHRVAWKAHTADAMRGSLDDNAMWVRRLMPVLDAPGAIDTVRQATVQPTDRAGNPKRRSPNTQWKYG